MELSRATRYIAVGGADVPFATPPLRTPRRNRHRRRSLSILRPPRQSVALPDRRRGPDAGGALRTDRSRRPDPRRRLGRSGELHRPAAHGSVSQTTRRLPRRPPRPGPGRPTVRRLTLTRARSRAPDSPSLQPSGRGPPLL